MIYPKNGGDDAISLSTTKLQEAREKTPSFMEFDVISTQQENVLEFVKELRSLMEKNKLVVVSEHKI